MSVSMGLRAVPSKIVHVLVVFSAFEPIHFLGQVLFGGAIGERLTR